jgi:hypothetical protein
MGFMISDPEQTLVRCQHLSLTDSEVETLIDALVERAGNEIRVFARQLRATEKNLTAHRDECDERQRVISAGEIARYEAEKVAGQRRQDELRAAEAINGPRRGGSWN